MFRLNVYDEAAIAPLLDTLAAEWGGEVAIGSYPVGWAVGSQLPEFCMLLRNPWVPACVFSSLRTTRRLLVSSFR